MGKPVWVLLPVFSDWRWLIDREDSPWYPTMRLFRQKAAADWDSIISRRPGVDAADSAVQTMNPASEMQIAVEHHRAGDGRRGSENLSPSPGPAARSRRGIASARSAGDANGPVRRRRRVDAAGHSTRARQAPKSTTILAAPFRTWANSTRRSLPFDRPFVSSPISCRRYNNLGNALSDNEALDEAIAVFPAGPSLKPDFAEAHNNLGTALKKVGQIDECHRRLSTGDSAQTRLRRCAQQSGLRPPISSRLRRQDDP